MLVVFVTAKLMAEAAERLGQPGIIGEILAGVLVGPSVLGWLTPNEFLSALSDLGAMFLLFRVGLAVKSSELMKVGGTATLVARGAIPPTCPIRRSADSKVIGLPAETVIALCPESVITIGPASQRR